MKIFMDAYIYIHLCTCSVGLEKNSNFGLVYDLFLLIKFGGCFLKNWVFPSGRHLQLIAFALNKIRR